MYWESFKTFFKIGIFTLGGGYAMIPLIEEEVVNKKQWVSKDEMLDLIAIAQSCPGVFAVNIATFIGYKLNKTRGAIATTIGTALPSFLIILAIAMVFSEWKELPAVEAAFKGIRPAVVALIAAPLVKLAKAAKISWATAFIPVTAVLLIWLLHVNPVWVILATILFTLLVIDIVERRKK